MSLFAVSEMCPPPRLKNDDRAVRVAAARSVADRLSSGKRRASAARRAAPPVGQYSLQASPEQRVAVLRIQGERLLVPRTGEVMREGVVVGPRHSDERVRVFSLWFRNRLEVGARIRVPFQIDVADMRWASRFLARAGEPRCLGRLLRGPQEATRLRESGIDPGILREELVEAGDGACSRGAAPGATPMPSS